MIALYIWRMHHSTPPLDVADTFLLNAPTRCLSLPLVSQSHLGHRLSTTAVSYLPLQTSRMDVNRLRSRVKTFSRSSSAIGLDIAEKVERTESTFLSSSSAAVDHPGVSDSLRLDPYTAAKLRVKNKLERDVAYRSSILRNVKTLQSLNEDEMRKACESMYELVYKKGEHIIKQNEKGDSMYLLKEGSVVVTRKQNPRDDHEEPTVLATLQKHTVFGEIALLTEEPRSASVSAIETCVCCIMKKVAFDEIVAASNAKEAKHRYNVGKSVINNVPLFRNLSAENKERVLELMTPLHYPTGSYICRQGTLGNSFFIIVDGLVKCTLNDPAGGPEQEVARLGSGCYFGEVSLMDPSSIRNANVVSVGDCLCMSISRADFSIIHREVKKAEEEKAAKALADKHAKYDRRNTSGTSGYRDGDDRDDRSIGNEYAKKKVTGMGPKASDGPAESMNTIVQRMLRFIAESSWKSLYSALYREMCLDQVKLGSFGSIAHAIMAHNPTRVEALASIRTEILRIGALKKSQRDYNDVSFLCGMLRQNNQLRYQCRDWHPFQFTDLCKCCEIKVFPPCSLIYDVNTDADSFYLIIKGVVRKWIGTSRTSLQHDTDLSSGQLFGVEVLRGDTIRKNCVKAISEVHIAVFATEAYHRAQNKEAGKYSREEIKQFFRSMPLFRRYDEDILVDLSAAVEQHIIPKNTVIVRKNELSNNLTFITDGYAQIVAVKGRNSSKKDDYVMEVPDKEIALNGVPYANIGEKGYFGESGFLNRKFPGQYFEEGQDAVSKTRLDVLVLKPAYFHLLNRRASAHILNSFRNKLDWRYERVDGCKNERKSISKLKKEMSIKRAPDSSSSDKKSTLPTSPIARNNTGKQFTFEDTERARSNSPMNSPVNAVLGATDSINNVTLPDITTNTNTMNTTESMTGGSSVSYASNEEKQGNLFDLNEVPNILDGDLDPFMVLDSCRTEIELKAKRRALVFCRTPVNERSRGRTVENTRDPGYVAESLASNGAYQSRPGTGHTGSDLAKERLLLNKSRDGRRPRTHTSPSHMSTAGTSTLVSGGDYLSQTGMTYDSGLWGTQESLSRPSSRHHLIGSSKIPSASSYVDTYDPIEQKSRPISRGRASFPPPELY